MILTEQEESTDETRSSYKEMYHKTSMEETSTSWSALEQQKKVLEEFNELKIDVSLSRKEAAQQGQYLLHKSYPRSFTSSSRTAFMDICPHRFF